jgi:hypothetical protein
VTQVDDAVREVAHLYHVQYETDNLEYEGLLMIKEIMCGEQQDEVSMVGDSNKGNMKLAAKSLIVK